MFAAPEKFPGSEGMLLGVGFRSLILSRPEILKAVKTGRIGIDPFNEKFVGSCSVDLHLGNSFRVFKKTNGKKAIEVVENAFFGKEFQSLSKVVDLNENETLSLSPGELVLGLTLEKITLPKNISGRLEGRSRFARMGLLVHVSSSLVQPGVDNNQVLEIMNMSPFTLKLHPKTRICQIIFEEVKGGAEYGGTFKKQDSV